MSENGTLPILIVEDDEPTQKLLQAVIRRSAFSSETCSDGASAIALLREKSYAAVVLDMMMPEVDGNAVIDFLSKENDPVPVIVCSAAGPRALAGLNERVVRAVVRKPFDVEQFLETIAAVTR